ncbi:Prefoldin subunit 6 [Elasticomyces elasticus]|uniref:Prefoldin subunit 6 n=1 Tax=Elasticomyces elasticus TaxID=574655 RepID=A0AAN7VX32_9PEZI|nr:Prefoldin subunit 6 [Elasticomyces elasticus]KAK4960583.1 Prefoldin subunit 6 [Elasticomyces elasticus]KAK4969747.1 Prefoldin subunit 6 [Elasticomyces elasticus]KAK5690447.1 Prefoldin subunit 6 [Elasticomyces elasticus]KAK5700298.1 Prefoldin subunit 6 [Elasticomyces elasticus]
MDQQKQLQALSDEYQGFQTELTTILTARQKLESQFTENKSVQKEFATLADDANIYKLVGPVLLKQDTTEAKGTVDGRLSYIEQEIKRIEESIKAIQAKSEGKKTEIMQIQSQMQQPAVQA